MAFRETIEAVLRVKDANRWKANMDKAARSVRKLGRDETETAAQTKILERVLASIDRQSIETMAVMSRLAASVDDLGDEMLQTAAKSQLANVAMKKSGSNAIFLGKSWAFWKDRLSLTRSELVTTALTIGTYFSPAIIAMGSSFAYAAIGGGGVALGGLSTLLFGLGSLMSIIAPAVDGMKKIQKAQEQYNLTVSQFGASSAEASRASAHLYAVISQNGGKAAFDATKGIQKLKKEWTDATAPGRNQIFGALNAGIGSARNAMPTLSTMANQMAQGFSTALRRAFKDLAGPDFLSIYRELGITFDKIIGPAIHGVVNLLATIGHITQATAPWVVKTARAWERTTASWREGTKDTVKLRAFFAKAVEHFRAWWGLAKELGRTLKIVFGASNEEGLKIVRSITTVVSKFNDWLQLMSDTGKIDNFWRKWEQLTSDAFDFFTHPNTWWPKFLRFIDTNLPVLMDHIANTFAGAAPGALRLFVSSWLEAGPWAKFLTAAVLIKKLGGFRAAGAKAGEHFVGPFMRVFGTAFVSSLVGEGAAAGLGGRLTAASNTLGRNMGKAAAAGFILGWLYLGTDIAKTIRDTLSTALNQKKFDPSRNPLDPGVTGAGGPQLDTWGILKAILPSVGKGAAEVGKAATDPPGTAAKIIQKLLFGGATGGAIPLGGMSLVGEGGPELASATATGTRITPLRSNSRHSLPSMMDIPNLEGAMSLRIYTSVQVDRREIARAVDDQNAYNAARRGGRARPSRTG